MSRCGRLLAEKFTIGLGVTEMNILNHWKVSLFIRLKADVCGRNGLGLYKHPCLYTLSVSLTFFCCFLCCNVGYLPDQRSRGSHCSDFTVKSIDVTGVQGCCEWASQFEYNPGTQGKCNNNAKKAISNSINWGTFQTVSFPSICWCYLQPVPHRTSRLTLPSIIILVGKEGEEEGRGRRVTRGSTTIK